MYEIKLDLTRLNHPLEIPEQLGLMQILQGMGFGSLWEIPSIEVSEDGDDLVLNNGVKSIRTRRDSITPINVAATWGSDEPEDGVRCIPGSRQDVQEILDWLGEDEEPEEVTINGVVHQCIKYPLDDILEAAGDTGYAGDISRIYTCREGEIHQHVAERKYRLEELGVF